MRRGIGLWGLTAALLLLGGASFGTSAQDASPPQAQALHPYVETSSRGGEEEVLIRPKLAEYLFGAQGGVLKSAYLYFAPAGLPPAELIPDTETRPVPGANRRERVYVQGAIFPFQLLLNGTPDRETRYGATVERRGGAVSLRFVADFPFGLRVVKTYTIADETVYTLDVRIELINTGNAPLSLEKGLVLLLGRGVGRSPDPEAQIRFLYGGEVKTEPLDAPDFGGMGFVGSGLVFFLKPAGDGAPHGLRPRRVTLDEGRTLWGLEIPQLQLPPRGERQLSFALYAGRAKYTLLAEEGLGELAPPGLFSQLVIAVVELLNGLYRATGNYGYAIILFTLITRILLFPLTRQQFHAMAKMAELRPKLEKLQQRYPTLKRLRELHPHLSEEELIKRDRENRRALQEKMMELYREEGVNPLGGCLPMLIQFPILIVLWRAILYSAEAIHLSPGFLWMSDLSLHDPYYLIVGLTALAMVLQTKTTPTMSPSSSQGPNPMIMMLFSIGLMVLFLKDFPSGLWLYYFLTTVIQVGQQVFINWELGHLQRKKAAAASPPGSPEPKPDSGSPGEEKA